MAARSDGAKLTRSVAHVLADTLRQHMEATEETRSEQGRRHVAATMEDIERELIGVVGPFLENITPDAAEHPQAAEALSWVAEPEHFVELLPLLMAIYPIVAGFVNALLTPSMNSARQLAWRHDTNLGLDPQQAAGAVIRGWIDQARGADYANNYGVSSADFQHLVNTGQLPPGPETVLAGWRRGLIGAGDVQRAIIESDIGSQWAAFFMQMKYQVMSPADAVRAAVQGHLSLGEAQAAFARGGADPAEFDVQYQTAGEPPGAGEMLELLNRGVVSEAQVTQAIQEGRTKNKYIPALLNLRYKIPPLRSVTSFVTKGAMTAAEGIHALQEDGYPAALAAKIVAAASTTKVATHKRLAEGHITALYEAKMVDRAAAESDLIALGYEKGEADLVLALADHAAAMKVQGREVSAIRSAFVHGRISEADAKGKLATAGVAAPAQLELLAEWHLEVSTRTRGLSEAQVIAATKKGVLTVDEAGARLIAMGYAETDAAVLLATAGLLGTSSTGATP